MPVTPQDLNDRRTESSVNKICDLVDRKLVETNEPFPFVFNFLPKTSPNVVKLVLDIYNKSGWDARVNVAGEFPVLFLIKRGESSKRVLGILTGNDRVLPPTPKEVLEQKNAVLLLSLETKDGKKALMQAMTEPIQYSLNSQNIARKILMVDEFVNREGLFADFIYDKDFYCWDGEKITNKSEPFTIKKTCSVNKCLTSKNYYIVDKLQLDAKNEIVDEEMKVLIKLLDYSSDGRNLQTYAETLNKCILECFGLIFSNNCCAAIILTNPKTFYKHITILDDFESATQRDILTNGLMGNYLGIVDIHIDNECPENTIYITASAQFVGSIRINKNDSTKISEISVEKNSISVTVESESTMSIAKNNCVQKIIIRD